MINTGEQPIGSLWGFLPTQRHDRTCSSATQRSSAMDPSASAASCRTMACSPASRSTRLQEAVSTQHDLGYRVWAPLHRNQAPLRLRQHMS